MLFMHSKGYTVFSMPMLTYPEINLLVDAENRRINKENMEQKKAARKSRIGRGKR